MLGRDVDPGAYSYWLGALNSGTPRSALAMALASSPEYRSDVISGTPTIQGFYMEYLGRPSDAAGAAYAILIFTCNPSNCATPPAGFNDPTLNQVTVRLAWPANAPSASQTYRDYVRIISKY